MLSHGDKEAVVDDSTGVTSESSVSDASLQASSQESTRQIASGTSSNQQMYVDVKGAVKNPGVYQINPNMRVVDAINLAGGYNRSADKKQINLAQKLTDAQVIYVPIRGEKGAPITSTVTPTTGGGESATADNSAPDDSGNTGQSNEQINLNTADKTKLQELNGIGDKKADQIIAYRQAHGQFKKN